MIGSIGSYGSQSRASPSVGMPQRPPEPDFEQMFSKIDGNGDGAIDEAELSEILQEASSGQAGGVEALFTALDTDGGSGVTQDEFTTAMESVLQQLHSQVGGGHMPPPPPPDAEDMFAETDADGDGAISATELSGALEARTAQTSRASPDADELFAQLDGDGDGSITQEELRAGLEALGPPHAQGPRPEEGDRSAAFIASVLQQYQFAAGLGSVTGSSLNATA